MQAHGALTGMSKGMNKDFCEPTNKTPAGKRSQFAASLSGKKSKKNSFQKFKKNKKEK